MFTPYRIAFAPPRESYRIKLLVTHKNGDFGAISVTERNRVDLKSGAAVQRAFLLGRIETRLFRNAPRDRQQNEAVAFVSL